MQFETVKGFLVTVIGDYVYDSETDEMIGKMLADDYGIEYFEGGWDCLICEWNEEAK